jgi:Domain of unknown function (DUF6458)
MLSTVILLLIVRASVLFHDNGLSGWQIALIFAVIIALGAARVVSARRRGRAVGTAHRDDELTDEERRDAEEHRDRNP